MKLVSPGESVVLACGKWAAAEPVFERSWRTTSDSIAAEVARQVGATELVMLKSSLPEWAHDPAGYLDPRFKQHLPETIGLRLVDLSRQEFPEG